MHGLVTREAVVERTFRASRARVWALVADTNRWDRAQGLSAASYSWRDIDGRRVRVARARELGFDIEWVEPPYQWVEGRDVRGTRRFLKGPIEGAQFTADLEDVNGGTRVRASSSTSATSILGKLVGRVMQVKQRAALNAYFDALQKVLADMPEAERTEGTSHEPPTWLARRSLLRTSFSEVVRGPRSQTDTGELVRRCAQLARAGISQNLVDKLIALLRDQPDEDLALIRPFEMATIWGSERRETLRLFLHATEQGVVDLRWQINCPVCRVGASVADHMTDIGQEAHCETCNIDYGVDLAKHVEAVFRCNAAIRSVETVLYCASSPSFLPHVSAQLSVEAGHTIREAVELAPAFHLRTLEGCGDVDGALGHVPEELHVIVMDDAIVATPSGTSADGSSTLRIESRASTRLTLLLERSGWSADVVLGSVVTSFPEFVQLFATEAPATGVDLAVSHIALLFTDLTGSTACYERLGDARAFALVQEHFADMEKCIADAGGALVKTMGDAVMASFASQGDAVKAAVAMVKANEVAHASAGLGVKVGVHAGPCLVVRANERLDFFGTTANVAARMQAQAVSGEVVIGESLASDPTVAPLLEGYGLRRFEAMLKGIRAAVSLVGIQVGRASPVAKP